MPAANDYHLLNNSLLVAAVLFSLGAVGFVCRRNLVAMLLSSGMMLQGAVMALAGFGAFYRDGTGDAFTLLALGVAFLQAILIASFVVLFVRSEHSLDVSLWTLLRSDDSPAGAETHSPLAADAEEDAAKHSKFQSRRSDDV